MPLLGQSTPVRFAAVALVVPLHALLWACARWQVTGRILRMQAPLTCIGRSIPVELPMFLELPLDDMLFGSFQPRHLEDSVVAFASVQNVLFVFSCTGLAPPV